MFTFILTAHQAACAVAEPRRQHRAKREQQRRLTRGRWNPEQRGHYISGKDMWEEGETWTPEAVG